MTVITAGGSSGPADLAGLELAGLRGVRLPDGSLADLDLAGGCVTSVRPHGAARPPAGGSAGRADAGAVSVVLDASGWWVLPAAAEPHAHLDKALSAPRAAATGRGAGNDLVAAIEQWRAVLPGVDADDVHRRGLTAVRRGLARGITAARSHVDVPLTGDPLRGVDGLLRLKRELAGVVELQVCLLTSFETPDAVVDEAAARGIDVIGGCPHLAPDPHREVTRALDAAERTGLPVDLHCDEQVDLPAGGGGGLDLVDLAQQVLARGLVSVDGVQRVTASHAVRLGSLTPQELAPVVDLLARAGIGIVTLPITNLYLQGWDHSHLVPRGITAVRALLDAGVALAAGADNLRDPFNPAGRADPFETTSLLMTAAHLRGAEALDLVTAGARSVMGLPAAGPVVGGVADLLLVPCREDGEDDVDGAAGPDLGDVLAGAHDARIVVAGGRVVADSRVQRSLALLPAPQFVGGA